MKRLLILVFFTGLTLSQAFSQPTYYSCERWQVLDIVINARSMPENPFELEFGAVMTHSSGKTMKIPGFYNGEKQWILRFCPNDLGNWTFLTYSSEPALTGKTGKIEVLENTKANEHGPLVICPGNKQKFSYADGSPYFLMAFELDWLFALDAEDENGIPKTKEIIRHVSENGFNQVIMNVYAYDAGWGERAAIKPEFNFAEPKAFPFGGTNTDPDHSKLNIEFFKRLDRVIAHLDEKEIISHLMIYVWNKKVNWPEANSAEDNMYFDYVVKRYQAFPNLVWDISKEALGYGHNDVNYISERIKRLRELDGHGRLLSVHDYGYCNRFPENVDFISVQAWRPDIFSGMRRIVKDHPDMPVFNIEHGGYEKTMHSIFDGAYTNAEVCLDRNYKCIFAGVYSCYYWQNSSWYEVVYDPGVLPAENQPKFSYFKHLTTLFEKYSFNELKPDEQTSSTYCLSNQKSIFMFYLPEGMIGLNGGVKSLLGSIAKCTWFDPLAGIYYDGGTIDFSKLKWFDLDRDKRVQSPMAILILEVI